MDEDFRKDEKSKPIRKILKINRKEEVSDSIKAETLGGRHEVRPLQENDRTYDENIPSQYETLFMNLILLQRVRTPYRKTNFSFRRQLPIR